MPDAKKASTPTSTPPSTTARALARAAAVEEDTTSHEAFWEAGRRLYQELQKSDQEVCNKIASAQQEQQQHLWKVQVDAQRRAEDLWRESWRAVNQAGDEDRQRVYQEVLRKYQEALWDIQVNVRDEWEAAGASLEKTLTNLHETLQLERIRAFNAFKRAAQKAWSKLDPSTLSCESLATIGQSLSTAASWVGGRPFGS